MVPSKNKLKVMQFSEQIYWEHTLVLHKKYLRRGRLLVGAVIARVSPKEHVAQLGLGCYMNWKHCLNFAVMEFLTLTLRGKPVVAKCLAAPPAPLKVFTFGYTE